MKPLRIALGYILSSVMGFLTIIIGPALMNGEIEELSLSRDNLESALEVIMIGSAFVGGIMFIPALIFLTVAWRMRGPSLSACLLFGGLGGALSIILIFLIDGKISNLSAMASTILLLGSAGLVAGLVFWFVAVWPRPPALPDASTSPKPTA